MARKSGKTSKTFKALDYRYSITVLHNGGRAVTTVVGNDSLNTWTRQTKRRIKGVQVGPGITVRTDHTTTLRFEGGAKVVSDNR